MMIDRNAAISNFSLEMATRQLALAPGKQLVADGEWHRCDVTNKPDGKGDGSYKLCLDGRVPFGFYRNWTDGKGVDYWSSKPSRPLTEAEREEFERWKAKAHAEDEKASAEAAAKACDEARREWNGARPASAKHAYLKRKRIEPHDLREGEHGDLLVPMYAPEGELVNLQKIAMIGDECCKWYLKGGRAGGSAFEISGDIGRVVVCEGFATGASINECTGYHVVVAFSAGNLSEVATTVRRKLHNADAWIWNAHQKVAADQGLRYERRQHFIDTELVIAADDDWQTKDNPGIFCALDAARAANARIAVPDFGKNREEKQTDFNDLAVAFKDDGHEYVKEDIEAAVEPNQLLEKVLLDNPYSAHGEAMVKQLHQVKEQDPEHYETLIARLKDKGVRIRTLEKAINAVTKAAPARAEAEANDLWPHWTVEPWDQPVDAGELLESIKNQITSYVATLGNRAIVVALWVMFTWVHSIAKHSPILLVTSAEADSGKTTLLSVIAFLARRALASVDISSAALFRSLPRWQPTIIVDEADTALVNNEDLRAVINSGWTRGSGVIRCDPETNEPRLFLTFAPKALGMKGVKLPDTTLSRTIKIELKRKQADEEVQDFMYEDDTELATLRRKLLRWANDHAESLHTAAPETPARFHNRIRANWRSLLAIAELAGGDAKREAWKAAKAIEGAKTIEQASLGVRLLSDIRDIFDSRLEDGILEEGILSRVLVAELIADLEKPWAEYRRDKPLTQKQLANLLADFGIRSEDVHPDADAEEEGVKHGKGYKPSRFEEVFARYLPKKPEKPASDPRNRANPYGTGTSGTFRSAPNARSARTENDDLSHGRSDLRGCADRNADSGENRNKKRETPAPEGIQLPFQQAPA
jgi:putative DNA primase/helicase